MNKQCVKSNSKKFSTKQIDIIYLPTAEYTDFQYAKSSIILIHPIFLHTEYPLLDLLKKVFFGLMIVCFMVTSRKSPHEKLIIKIAETTSFFSQRKNENQFSSNSCRM